MGGLGGQHQVGVLDQLAGQRLAEELVVAEAARGERLAHHHVHRVLAEAVGAGAGEGDRGIGAGQVARGQLHERRAADVGGADEEDVEAVVGRLVGLECGGGSRRWCARHARAPSGSGASTGSSREVDVAGVAQRVDHVVEGILDGAPGGVDPHVGVLGLLVGRGDAGELGDLPAPGLGVEALAVAALALLQRRGHVHQEERAAGVVDHRPHLLPGLVERRDRAAHRDATVARDLGRDPADPPDVGLAVLLGEGEAGRQVPAYDVAVEAGDRAPALLEEPVHQRPGQGRLAAAREPGEEQHQPLLGRARGWSRPTISVSSSGSSPPSWRPCTGSGPA